MLNLEISREGDNWNGTATFCGSTEDVVRQLMDLALSIQQSGRIDEQLGWNKAIGPAQNDYVN